MHKKYTWGYQSLSDKQCDVVEHVLGRILFSFTRLQAKKNILLFFANDLFFLLKSGLPLLTDLTSPRDGP